jgi:ferredoxin-type protein NapF
LPFSLGKFTGLSNWLSPFIMLNSVLLLKSFVIANGVGLFVISMVLFRKRWFCNYLCPVGFLQDVLAGSVKTGKKISVAGFPSLSRWLVLISLGGALFGIPVFLLLDPLVIFNDFFVPLIKPFEYIVVVTAVILPFLLILELIIPDLWCEKICPLGGLQLILKDIANYIDKRSDKSLTYNEGRRLFIGGSVGAAAALVFSGITASEKPAIRPPGSIRDKEFNALCIRCGSCIKVCPSGILQHETRVGMSLLTPKISFTSGYCIENCNSCGTVCPSGAITKFSVVAKKELKIAEVNVSPGTCLLMKYQECGICIKACKYDSIYFKVHGRNSLQMEPAVHKEKCNGCGACSIICPENCFEMKRANNGYSSL